MRKILFIICCGALILCGAASSFAQAQTKTPSAENLQKQKRAEEVVIRAMRRFGQTLNFQDVFKETFIKDKTVRRALFEDDLKDENYNFTKFSNSELTKIYIRTQNFNWLDWIYFFRANKNGDYISTHANPDDLIKHNVLPKLNKRQRILYERSDEEIKSQTDLLELLNISDVVASVIRNRFPRNLRSNLQNNITVTSRTSSDKDRLLEKFEEVYYVTAKIRGVWGHFSFTVVGENGAMKIAYIVINDGKQ